MTKKAPVIFHNLKGYDSHLSMQEIGKFDVNISVIQNWLERYMAFTINNLFTYFFNSSIFMNFSLNAFVKNLSDNDFKFLSREVTCEFLKLVKQKGMYPYEYMDSFKKVFWW